MIKNMIRLGSLGYFTAQEAAEYLGMPRQSLYKLRDKGVLPEPVLIFDRMIIWKVSDIKKTRKTLNINGG